ncbi:MAG: glycosyltransferase [Fibrobacteria bacterium]|nr:glycosyltransferase [Fibrobacteria bacterium]
MIVSYRVRERLRACLESLRQLDPQGPSFEVIVVDNASGDGTCEQLPAAFPEVQFLPMDRNLGFSIGCNRGASRSKGRFLLFLNPDTVVFPDTLRKVVEFADTHPEAGIVGCRILDGDGRLQLACRRSIPTLAVALPRLTGLSFLFPKSRVFGRYNLTYLDPEVSTPVEAVSGSFLMIRKNVFDSIKGFDEDYFLYAEDLDLCLRVARAGHQIWYCGEASIIHHKGQSAATRPWGARMDFYRAMVVFARKNLGVGPVLELFLNLVAAGLATGNVLASQVRDLRSLALDLATSNLVFAFIAMMWLGGKGIGNYLSTPLGWAWHLVFSVAILAGQIGVGAYRLGPSDLKKRALGVGISLGVFLGVGLVLKHLVFSRAVFVLGGALAGLALLMVSSLAQRNRPAPMRVVVAGTGAASLRVSRLLKSVHRVRVVGMLAMSDFQAVEGDLMVVARMPYLGPAAKALELAAIVVPGDDPEVARMLVELAGTRRTGLKLLLALLPAGTDLPALVDITLDRSFIPERQA